MTDNGSISQDGAPEDIAAGITSLAELINYRVGAWHDFGYADPPAPECKAIPPLGERSAEAVRNGHQAVRDIDEMIRQLHALRGQLVSELRQDEDIRAIRVDAMLAGHAALRNSAADSRPAGGNFPHPDSAPDEPEEALAGRESGGAR